MRRIETESDITEGITALIAVEPRFGEIVRLTGHPPLRRTQGGFKALASIITEQMLSLHAANAIWKRMLERIDPFESQGVIDASDEVYREAGQSMAKVRTLRAIATGVIDGTLCFDDFEAMDDDAVQACLTSIKGIGPWTAEIYLLSCMGRRDVLPKGDVALQVAAELAFELEARPSAKELVAMSQPWRPWRSVAARVLWSYYRHVKLEGG